MRKNRKINPTKGGKSAAFALNTDQQKTIDEFKSKAATLDVDLDAFLLLAIKVKAIFAAKDRGAVIEGCSTFDEFVEKVFKKSARTVRSWLAQIGETDQRFANQPNSNRAGGKNHYKPEWSTVVAKDNNGKSITLLDVKSFAHKAIRDGDENSAVAWMKILYDHGCKVWKQILIYAVEDIGLADLSVKTDVLELEQIAAKIKDDRRSDWLAVIAATIRCCRSKKSRATDNAAIWFNEHRSYVPPTSAEVEAAAQAAKNAVEGGLPPIPDKAWDMHTAKGRSMGRGKDHFKQKAAALANKSEVVDFRPPAVAVPITLTDEQVRYLAALLEDKQDAIAVNVRSILATSIAGCVAEMRSKQDRQTKANVVEDRHMHEITPQIFVGSQAAIPLLRRSNPEGITHVLNCTPDKYEAPTGIKVYDLAMPDNAACNPEIVRRGLEFIHKAVSDGGKVLVHCRAGVSRSRALVAGYLAAYHETKWEDAKAEVLRKPPLRAGINKRVEASVRDAIKDTPPTQAEKAA